MWVCLFPQQNYKIWPSHAERMVKIEDGILFEQRVGWAPFYQQFYNMTATWTRPEVSCFGWENTHHGHIIVREHLMGRLDQSTEERDTVISLVIISLL